MNPSLARSIAETAASVLAQRASGAHVFDEEIGRHLWFERGFRHHDDLVSLINFAREMLDQHERAAPARPDPSPVPYQLSLDLEAA